MFEVVFGREKVLYVSLNLNQKEFLNQGRFW